MPKKIIVDTSSILYSVSKGRDLFATIRESMPDYRAVISRGVVRELQKMGSTRRKESRDARMALEMTKDPGISIMADLGYVDSWILKEATSTKGIVCTNDSELKKKLHLRGITVLSVGRDGRLR